MRTAASSRSQRNGESPPSSPRKQEPNAERDEPENTGALTGREDHRAGTSGNTERECGTLDSNANHSNKEDETEAASARKRHQRRLSDDVSALGSSVVRSLDSYLGSYLGLDRDRAAEPGPKSGIVFGFFAGKLSDVYRDANRKLRDANRTLRGTREILQNVPVESVTGAVSEYVSRLTRELPVVRRIRATFVPRDGEIEEAPENGREEGSASIEEDPENGREEGSASIEEDPENEREKGSASRDLKTDRDVLSLFPSEPGVGGWPRGSVVCVEGGDLRVFQQKLVVLPAPLAELTLLRHEEVLARLPEVNLGKIFSVFFAATEKRPLPTPGGVAVCARGLAVIRARTESGLSVERRFAWSDVKTVEVGLGGQSVRVERQHDQGGRRHQGGNEGGDQEGGDQEGGDQEGGDQEGGDEGRHAEDLAVLTLSARLTQEFCREIVRAQSVAKCSNPEFGDQNDVFEEEPKHLTKNQLCRPREVGEKQDSERFSQSPETNGERTEGSSPGSGLHPLLSSNLMSLSLDWTSTVQDLVLPNGLRLRSRFKRVLADLLYLVHGNMEGPDRPSLAHIRPVVFTSVVLRSDPGGVGRFLLTDSHVCLLPGQLLASPPLASPPPASLGAGLGALRVRARAEVRCVFARSVDGCVELEVVFHSRRRTWRNVEERRSSLDVSALKENSATWNVRFGDSSDAAVVLKQLWT